MCGAAKSAASEIMRLSEDTDLVRVFMPFEERGLIHEDDPNVLKVYVLRRYLVEGDIDWMKGLDVVVAYTLGEALDIAEATHPGAKKLGRYKSYNIVLTDSSHFAYGKAFEGQVIHY